MAAIDAAAVVRTGIQMDAQEDPDKRKNNIDANGRPQAGATGNKAVALAAGGSQANGPHRVAPTEGQNSFAMSHKMGGKGFRAREDGDDVDPITGQPSARLA